MQVLDVDGAKISVSVDVDAVNFIGEDGKDASRTSVKVTIWEHMDTGRKYQQLIPVASGYAFCQPTDDFDFYTGARKATTNALDQIGYSSNINHVVKKVHQLVKAYATQQA
jgi:hypothetical protein